MSRDSLIDYSSYILFRIAGFFIRRLPKSWGLFLGRGLGDVFYYFDNKHRAIAYTNIKTALGAGLSPSDLSRLTHQFYRNFGQSLIEIFFVPLINKEYLEKYISIEGTDNIRSAFEKGKGVILLGVHEGSWELSNVILASLGFPFVLLVRDQIKYKRVNELLNLYRIQKGCKLIHRQQETRQLIEVLKKNEAIGLTADQGGSSGVSVKFFGRDASMSSGAVRLALKTGAIIVPGFWTRLKGSYSKVIVEPPFEVRSTGERRRDIEDNLQRLIAIYEKYINLYPKEYFWPYKIWKYSLDKNILILSDSRAGHLRQAQAVGEIARRYFKQRGINAVLENTEVKFKNKFARALLVAGSCLYGKYRCQGCLVCLRMLLTRQSYDALVNKRPDIIISCGSWLAPVNYILARENLAKSIVVLRPPNLAAGKFDLVIMPRHDNPAKKKNIAVTEGALNLINEEYLKEQSEKLIQSTGFYIGILIGGDTKSFKLKKDTILEVIKQVKAISEELSAEILITTSRRTPREIEALVKAQLGNYPRCKFLIIANQRNIPEAIGGILGLSKIVIVSPESISMISEAASSGRYVIVFDSPGVGKKHRRFLDYFVSNKYIFMAEGSSLGRAIKEIWSEKPEKRILQDNIVVEEAVKRIL